MKVTLCNKEISTGSQRGVEEAENQINGNIRKKKTFNQNSKKKKEYKKKNPPKNRINLWDIFKGTNIRITGVPKMEEKEQNVENLFEKLMKENFPNLVKETDIQVQEAQSPQTTWTQKGTCQDMS